MLDPREQAVAVAATVRSHATEIEAERRLPRPLVDEMAERGLFRLCVPRELGGIEAPPAVLIETIETVARADGSAGWCVMIGSTTGFVSAYLPEDAAREIYGADPLAISGGVFAPRGMATVEGSDYRVSGRWPFASGCGHCTWLMGGCIVVENGEPRRQPGGAPDPVMLVFPAKDVVIHDTWNVAGLRGTGSHDIEVSDLFVPGDRAVALVTDTPRATGPLYAFPVFGLLALGIAGVALGIARSAIDDFAELAVAKHPGGSRRSLADRPATQAEVARSEAQFRAARAFLYGTVDNVWQSVQAGGPMTVEQRALLRLAASHATETSAAVVAAMYRLGGGSSIYESSRLQRCFRDVHVATQHMMVAEPTFELSGRVLLGLETDASQL